MYVTTVEDCLSRNFEQFEFVGCVTLMCITHVDPKVSSEPVCKSYDRRCFFLFTSSSFSAQYSRCVDRTLQMAVYLRSKNGCSVMRAHIDPGIVVCLCVDVGRGEISSA